MADLFEEAGQEKNLLEPEAYEIRHRMSKAGFCYFNN